MWNIHQDLLNHDLSTEISMRNIVPYTVRRRWQHQPPNPIIQDAGYCVSSRFRHLMRGTLWWKVAANSDGLCGVALSDEPVAEVLVNIAAVVGDGAVPAPGSAGEIVLGGLA